MKNKKIISIVLGLFALSSCTTVTDKANNSNQNRPRIVVKKEENHLLPNYTLIGEESYGERNFEFSGEYIYKGEQPDADYIDTETIVKKVNIVPKTVTIYKAPENHKNYNKEQIEEFDRLLTQQDLDTMVIANRDYKFDKDDYVITVRKKGTGKWVPGVGLEYYYIANVAYKNENQLQIIIKSTDTGEEKAINLSKQVEVRDPKTVATEYLKDHNRLKDLKEGFDNKRLSFEILTADKGLGPYEIQGEDDYSLEKYKDLDDLKGEHSVLVRVRAYRGYASNRDSYIEDQAILFGDMLSDYNSKYDELFSDLSTTPLKFSKDGTSVIGGFDEYKTSRLIDENLEFRTIILNEDPSKPTVGKHSVLREIVKDGNVIASKKDDTFVGFSSPTVLVADYSFFDLPALAEKRTYRQTPYYTDPKIDFNGEMEKYISSNPHLDDATKDFLRKQALLDRTHGATVIGAMADELSYGGELFWLANGLGSIARVGQDSSTKRQHPDEELWKSISAILERIKLSNPDSIKLHNISVEIKEKTNELLVPIIEKRVTRYSEKRKNWEAYYGFLFEKAREIMSINENEKLAMADLSYQVFSIGKSESNVDVIKSSKYLPKILDDNKNIKIVNMSYGNDSSIEDYMKIDTMTKEEKEKAVEAYNTRPAYRFLILAWLKEMRNEVDDIIRKNYQDSFNALDPYDYFTRKKNITVADFNILLNVKKAITEARINASKEFSSANHDVLFVRSGGNTYSYAQVDLTSFTDSGKKRLIEDPNKKYNNNFASMPSLINYLAYKEAVKENKKFEYDYSFRKNILNVVGVVPKTSIYGMDSKEDLGGYVVATTSKESLVYKNLTPGMADRYLSLVKELNRIRTNPNDYPEDYRTEIEEQVKAIEVLSGSKQGEKDYFSFSRAGDAKLWTVAALGEYIYVSDVDNKGNAVDPDYNYKINPGSSFSAPRVSAVAARVQALYPFMTAHDIKQTILTTAKDDFIITLDSRTQRPVIKGVYGVDENIGWGYMDKNSAFKGPARFTKALTHEVGQENFVANIPYGSYEFSNDIQGGFNPTEQMTQRGYLTVAESQSLTTMSEDERNEFLQNKTIEYVKTLPFEERELFLDAGLYKSGKGTLVLSGRNTYTGDTIVKEGTLVERGSSKSLHIVHEGAKLKLDLKYRAREEGATEVSKSIFADVHSNGELYSYSDSDIIAGTYYPYEKSKTYVAVGAKLSIANMSLVYNNDFNIEVFRPAGDTTFIRYGGNNTIFEAKVSAEDITKVRLGRFAISKALTLDLNYIRGTLIANIERGGTSFENTDRQAILGTGGLPSPYSLNVESRLMKDIDNGSDVYNNSVALSALQFMSDDEINDINGKSLVDSLTIAYDIEDARLANLERNLDNDIIKESKFSLSAEVLTRLIPTKDSVGRIIVGSQVTGTQLALKYKKYNQVFGIAIDYINATKNKDLINTTKSNSLGISLLMKNNYKDVELSNIVSFNGLIKNVTKDVIYESKEDQDLNQMDVNILTKLAYNVKVNDKFSVKPSILFNNYFFIFDNYKHQNSILGFKMDRQFNYNINTKLGIEAKYNVNDKFRLSFNGGVAVWLTKPSLRLNIVNQKYEDIKNEVSSASFSNRYYLTAGIGFNYLPTNNVSINFNYDYSMLTKSTLKLGLEYAF